MKFETEEDKIGRKEFVDKIALCVDHLANDQNICIAIDGGWGSGKSFVMEKLYERLNVNDSYLVVRYDAWECSYYEEPLIAVFCSILDSANEKLLSLHNRGKGAKAVVKEIGKDLLETFGKQKNIFGALATILKKIKQYAAVYKKGIILDTKNEDAAYFRSYQSYLREVKACLNGFTALVGEAGEKNKLIILVDELDRCLPDMQLKILERLHHLFDVKNCAVICAINAARVADNMKATYGVDGYEYLRKFFDLTYKLEMSASIYLENLLDDFAKKISETNDLSSDEWNYIDVAYGCLLYSNKQILTKIDNREISRYYECLWEICDRFGWERLNPRYAFFIIVGLFIRKEVAQTFLSEKEILENMKMEPTSMPYFDYLQNYLEVNIKKLEKSNLWDRKYYAGEIPVFIYQFNEIVHFSIVAEQDNLNPLRHFHGLAPVIVKDCNELRRLIILYGGEQRNA